MSDFNAPRRLFELYKALTGEDLSPIKNAEKHGQEAKK